MILRTGILTAAIRVMEQPWLGVTLPNGPLQGLRDSARRHGGRTGPAHDFAGKQLHHNREIQPPFLGPEGGDITAPHSIRRRDRKLPVEYIRGKGQGMAAIRRLRTPPCARGLQIRLAHQGPCPIATDRMPSLLQGLTQSARALAATRGPMELLNLKNQRWICLRPASSTLHKPIIPTGTHLEDGTAQPDRIRLPFTVNEGISQMLWVAKKAVAVFKMSRSIRRR